jgi:lysophospholipase L1-like esterase
MLLLGTLIVSIAVAEIVARLFFGTSDKPMFDAVSPSEHDFEKRRGTTVTYSGATQTFDQDGFRIERPLADSDRTILFVGDSFTLGYGAPDGTSFVAYAAQALRQHGIKSNCLNAGSQRWGTAQELRLLRRLLDTRQVDAIVFQIFPFNDLRDNFEDGGFRVQEGRLIENNPPDPPWYITAQHWISAAGDDWTSSALAVLIVTRLLAGRFTPTAKDVELERQLLLQVIATAHSHDTPIVFAVVGEVHDCTVEIRGMNPDDPYVPIRDLVVSLDVPSLDLCTVTPAENHFQQDGHYSNAGNALVGNALAERLIPLVGPGAPHS